MIVTYNWLKEFVDFDASPAQLCDDLTMAGLEVESMTTIGADLDTVIVARLDTVEPHPDADRLTLCEVDKGDATVQVVCGATNHRAGDLVALAQPGTVLPGDFKIKKSKIRGQVSEGMLCSEKELALAEESPGIMILPPGLEIGTPLFEALDLKDVRIELGLTPNRPDCLSIVGVAREVAALYRKPLRLPEMKLQESAGPISEASSVTIENEQGCPRYAARMISDVRIAPSPDWLVRRLEAAGMRSINNVVDVTNFVMMELGHPLHAFDFRFLEEGRIVVRSAREGDRFTTLDDQEHVLSSDDLMICDGRKPVALAGVMGGQNSEVQPDTQTVLLEAAYFEPTGIRRTSKRHGLHTESSHRFERGADIDMVPVALDRAAGLIAELGEGRIHAGVLDTYPRRPERAEIALRVPKVCALLDISVTAEDIRQLLESIGLEVAEDGEPDLLQVTVPSFRPDLERDVDLIEEVARLHGYGRIPVTLPTGTVDAGLPPREQAVPQLLRRAMAENGFCEAMNYSFVSGDNPARVGIAEDDPRWAQVPLLNPLSEDQTVMRTTLVPSLLDSVARNLNYRSSDLRLFELRPVFLASAGEKPVERLSLGAVMTGRRAPEGWAQGDEAVDFYDLKGVIEELLQRVALPPAEFFSDAGEAYLHPGKSARFAVAGQDLGTLGEVHPRVLTGFGIGQPVFLLELDVAALLNAAGRPVVFKPLSRYPDVIRDSALLLDEQVTAAEVLDVVEKARTRSMESITLFDLYRGKGIPPGKKSLAVRVRYRDQEKTLTEDEVSRWHDKLVRALCRELAAEIR